MAKHKNDPRRQQRKRKKALKRRYRKARTAHAGNSERQTREIPRVPGTGRSMPHGKSRLTGQLGTRQRDKFGLCNGESEAADQFSQLLSEIIESEALRARENSENTDGSNNTAMDAWRAQGRSAINTTMFRIPTPGVTLPSVPVIKGVRPGEIANILAMPRILPWEALGEDVRRQFCNSINKRMGGEVRSEVVQGSPLCHLTWRPVASAADGFFCPICDAFLNYGAMDFEVLDTGTHIFKICKHHGDDVAWLSKVFALTRGLPPVPVEKTPLLFLQRPPEADDETWGSLYDEGERSFACDNHEHLQDYRSSLSSSPSPVMASFLAKGRFFPPKIRPSDIPRMPVGMCLDNVERVCAKARELTPVVGFTSIQGKVFEHVWCADGAGRVVDATGRRGENDAYFGVPVRREALPAIRRFVTRRAHSGDRLTFICPDLMSMAA
jgi:hypothetical protein